MPSPSRLPAFEVREQSRSRGSDGSALASERQAEGVACRQAHHLAGARDFAVGSPRCSIDGKGGDDMTPTGTERTTVEADVLRADDQRFDAMRRGDWTALDAALADDLIYVHSTARQESKAEHIANLRAGKPNYRGIAPRDRRVRIHGGVGMVIGATVFIGPRLIRKLVARGESVVGMDLNPGAATFAGVPIGAPVVRGDVTQFEDVMRTVLDVKPERLINLAYGLGAGEGNPHQVMRLDILGMDNCFEAARLGGVKRVVYASSVAVSGQQSNFGDRLATEDDPMYGTSQYAMHKIFNEFQAKKYIKNYGMSIIGVRPANVTGPDKVRGSVDHVQIMTDAARGKAVHLPKKGLMRLLIHVEDIAEVFARVLLADAPRHALYNSGGIPVSLGDLAEMVREFLPEAQMTFANDGGIEESGNYLVDNSRLRQEFEVEYPPFRSRVLDIINDIRRQEGLPQVQ